MIASNWKVTKQGHISKHSNKTMEFFLASMHGNLSRRFAPKCSTAFIEAPLYGCHWLLLAHPKYQLVPKATFNISQPPPEFFRFTIIMTAFGNTGNLPLAIVASVCHSDDNPFGTEDDCTAWGGICFFYQGSYSVL
ncbi:unnamed protein product [Prunus armeniaca]|uniref:Uncharacterized protein n=1 Tax=Prunus armeniaca TaxID=36596 RepID=A0A6J5UE50_PRUAR|nr:unnamed protein product [Prunus armeniaca]